MTTPREREIEQEANRLLRSAGVKEAPVPVELIAENLGIRIERSDLGTDCSGILVRHDGGATLGVNWDHHPNRQRFTIAHEIGHYRLHTGETYVDGRYLVHFRDLESGSGTRREEIEANAFAAALLMPAAWVKEAFRHQPFDLAEDDGGLRELARRFEVSTQAMTYRLMKLRIA